jgi:ribose 5-phosphate isomerase B
MILLKACIYKRLRCFASIYNKLRIGGETSMRISFGCDHAGFPIKEKICKQLELWGYSVVDHGCYDGEMVDFPEIAKKVCKTLLDGEADRGIMLCGTGVGAAIACNKVAGIRASCCHDVYSSHQCVEHDDANVACIGADIVGPAVACELLQLFLNAKFNGEKEFLNRVKMLEKMDYEK